MPTCNVAGKTVVIPDTLYARFAEIGSKHNLRIGTILRVAMRGFDVQAMKGKEIVEVLDKWSLARLSAQVREDEEQKEAAKAVWQEKVSAGSPLHIYMKRHGLRMEQVISLALEKFLRDEGLE